MALSAQKVGATKDKPARWFSLPPEIRNMVYVAAYVESPSLIVVALADWRETELHRRRQARTMLKSYEPLQPPSRFIDRFLVSRQWLDEARAAFFSASTVQGIDCISSQNLAPILRHYPPVDKHVTALALSLSRQRSLASVFRPNAVASLPQLRALHLSVSTILLEDIGLEVWDVVLSDADIRRCPSLVQLAGLRVKQLRKLSLRCEVEKRFKEASGDLRARCEENMRRVQEVFVAMRAERVKSADGEKDEETTVVPKTARETLRLRLGSSGLLGR